MSTIHALATLPHALTAIEHTAAPAMRAVAKLPRELPKLARVAEVLLGFAALLPLSRLGAGKQRPAERRSEPPANVRSASQARIEKWGRCSRYTRETRETWEEYGD